MYNYITVLNNINCKNCTIEDDFFQNHFAVKYTNRRENTQHSQFHKTLPKSSLPKYWISVRFYEMGDANKWSDLQNNETIKHKVSSPLIGQIIIFFNSRIYKKILTSYWPNIVVVLFCKFDLNESFTDPWPLWKLWKTSK